MVMDSFPSSCRSGRRKSSKPGGRRNKNRRRGRGPGGSHVEMTQLNEELQAFHIGSAPSAKSLKQSQSKPTRPNSVQNSDVLRSHHSQNFQSYSNFWEERHLGLGFRPKKSRSRQLGRNQGFALRNENDKRLKEFKFQKIDGKEDIIVCVDEIFGWKFSNLLIPFKMNFVRGGLLNDPVMPKANSVKAEADKETSITSQPEHGLLSITNLVSFIETDDDDEDAHEQQSYNDENRCHDNTKEEVLQTNDEILMPCALVHELELGLNLPANRSSMSENDHAKMFDEFISVQMHENLESIESDDSSLSSHLNEDISDSSLVSTSLFFIDTQPSSVSSSSPKNVQIPNVQALGDISECSENLDEIDDPIESAPNTTIDDLDLQNYDNEPLHPLFSSYFPSKCNSAVTLHTVPGSSTKRINKRRNGRGFARMGKQEKVDECPYEICRRVEEMELMMDYFRNINCDSEEFAIRIGGGEETFDQIGDLAEDMGVRDSIMRSFIETELDLSGSDRSSDVSDSDDEHLVIGNDQDSESETDLDTDTNEAIGMEMSDDTDLEEEEMYLYGGPFPDQGKWGDDEGDRDKIRNERKFKMIEKGLFEDFISDCDGESDEENVKRLCKSARRKLGRKLRKEERNSRLTAAKAREKIVYGVAKNESWGKRSKRKRLKNGSLKVDLEGLHKLVKSFVKDDEGIQCLPLPPMPSTARRTVTRFSKLYNIKTKTRGSGKSKILLLIRTCKTALPAVEDWKTWKQINAIVKEGERNLRMNKNGVITGTKEAQKDKTTKKKVSLVAPSTRHRIVESITHGSIVGQAAPPISQNNIGHQLLLNMGWQPGQSLGAGDNGIKVPLEAVVRGKRRGLGT